MPVLVTWIHALIGLSVVIVGLFLIVEWRFRPPPKMTCVKRRSFMKPLLITWITALLLGIVTYAYAYLV
jgi:type IV secretory pathway TrbD component